MHLINTYIPLLLERENLELEALKDIDPSNYRRDASNELPKINGTGRARELVCVCVRALVRVCVCARAYVPT